MEASYRWSLASSGCSSTTNTHVFGWTATSMDEKPVAQVAGVAANLGAVAHNVRDEAAVASGRAASLVATVDDSGT